LAELRASRKKMQRARAYLASPGSNPALGQAYLESAAQAHAKHLVELRDNRRRAWELVGRLDAELGTGDTQAVRSQSRA
jgi:hypothetical protein